MEPTVAPSARRHGVADEDILHAYRNYVRARLGRHDLQLLIGADRAGRLLEIGVRSRGDGEEIVHAMPARPEYLR